MKVIEYLTILTRKYQFLDRRRASNDECMQNLKNDQLNEIDKIKVGGKSNLKTLSKKKLKSMDCINNWHFRP